MPPPGSIHPRRGCFVAGKLAETAGLPADQEHQGIEPVEAAYRRHKPFVQEVMAAGMGQLVGQDVPKLSLIGESRRQEDDGLYRPHQQGRNRQGGFPQLHPTSRLQLPKKYLGRRGGCRHGFSHLFDKGEIPSAVPAHGKEGSHSPQNGPKAGGIQQLHQGGGGLLLRGWRWRRGCAFLFPTGGQRGGGLLRQSTGGGEVDLRLGLSLNRAGGQGEGDPHRQAEAQQHQQPEGVQKGVAYPPPQKGTQKQQERRQEGAQQAQAQQAGKKGKGVHDPPPFSQRLWNSSRSSSTSWGRSWSCATSAATMALALPA